MDEKSGCKFFAFNAMILCVFGVIFGFDKAGYSILFQFISTKTISTFHTRYKRVMLHIYTVKKTKWWILI